MIAASRRTKKVISAVAIATALLTAPGCGKKDSALNLKAQDASVVDKATGRIGPAGGTVTLLSGATLVIPPGALSQDVDISVIQTGLGVPQDLAVTSLSAIYQFSPDGLVFNLPVTVSFPVTGNASDATVYWTLPATTEQYEDIGGVASSDATVMEVPVTHFSRGFVAKKPSAVAVVNGADAAAIDAATDAGVIIDYDAANTDATVDGAVDGGLNDGGVSTTVDAAVDAGVTVTMTLP